MAKQREGWFHKPVFGISVSMIITGIGCFPLGIVALYYSLATTCYRHPYDSNNYYNRHNHYGYDNYGNRITTTTTTTVATTTALEAVVCYYYGSMFSAGIWVGLMFIATGVVGVIAARTKTTCMILSTLILSVPCFFFAVAGIGFSIYSQMDGVSDLVSTRPWPMNVTNGILTLMSFAAMVLDIILFSFATRAICCCKKFNTVHYTEITGSANASSEMDVQPANVPNNTFSQNLQQFPTWPGFTPMQIPPQMQPPTSTNGQMAPSQQMFMLMPNGQGGFIPQPFQVTNFDQMNVANSTFQMPQNVPSEEPQMKNDLQPTDSQIV